MRNLSANALSTIATNYGTEPVNIIEVQWVPDGSRLSYADRETSGIPGRILALSPIDDVIDVSGGAVSRQISITLDDTNGSLKAILDSHDVHKRPVWVYQWFDGLDLADKFLLFRGQINSPIVWSESERTVSFEVITRAEEKEIGFSAEEGQFPEIPDDLIGKPWPMIFGTCLDVPALSINKTITGTTQQGIGILSGKELHLAVAYGGNVEEVRANAAQQLAQINHLRRVAFAWDGFDDVKARQYRRQANQISAQISLMFAQLAAAEECAKFTREDSIPEGVEGPSIIRILGGEDFPQGVTVTVDINGGQFTGIFDCDTFYIKSRRHPDNEERAQEAFEKYENSACNVPPSLPRWDFWTEVPRGRGDTANQNVGQEINRNDKKQVANAQSPKDFAHDSGFLVDMNPPKVIAPPPAPVAQHFWAEAGSTVKLIEDQDQTYIVSIVPGTVLAVKAYKQFDGIRKLVNVPNELWEQQTLDFDVITAEAVVLSKQLSSIPEQGWEDELYVTFQSSVGPNTVDIMEYLIENYSDLGIDATSFNYVKTKLTPFPSNFAILDRPQILTILKDIAFQARCAIVINDDVCFLKYLPEEPTSIQTISVSDVAHKSLTVEITGTEDLVTKMVVKWRLTYAEDSEQTMILRHNVAKYGVQEEEYDWFIYNQPDIIRKAATFWLIRKSNSFKRVKFKGYLNLLNVETFDAVTLNLPGYAATGSVKAIVENATYDSASNVIDFQCLTPVKAGTMETYPFFWPAAYGGEFPGPDDFGGGDNVGKFATGRLPVGSISHRFGCDDTGIFIGGPNVIFQGPADLGDPRPADTGFEAQPVVPDATIFDIVQTPRPTFNPSTAQIATIPIPPMQPITQGTTIDLSDTIFTDTGAGVTQPTNLLTIFRGIEDGVLTLRHDPQVSDGENVADFRFEFDPESEQFGALIAFLAEDE